MLNSKTLLFASLLLSPFLTYSATIESVKLTDSYFVWEGGDPIAADSFSDELPLFNMDFLRTHTLTNGHLTKGGEDDPLCEKDGLWEYISCDQERTKDFLHKLSPSVGNLFPTYPFLKDSTGDTLVPQFTNTFLKNLNQSSPEQAGVETYRIAGRILNPDGSINNESTVFEVFVDTNRKHSYLYTDGEPITVPYSDGVILTSKAGGDETVPTFSVGEPFTFANGYHSQLIEKSKDKIINYLNE